MKTNTDGWNDSPATDLAWNPEGLASDLMESDAGPQTFEVQEATDPAIDQDLPRLLYEVAARLPMQPDVQALCIWLFEPAGQVIRLHLLPADLPAGLKACLSFPAADSLAGWIWKRQQIHTINTEAETRFSEFARALLKAHIKSFCGVPLIIASRQVGVLGLGSSNSEAFGDFKRQQAQCSSLEPDIATEYHSGFQSRISPPPEHRKESAHLEEKVRPEDKFEEIIGRSASLRASLDQLKIVAPTDSTVLILGETGTGKELIARAIHNRSGRRNKPLVRVNCAAIPAGLLESELFGHERGAFTGAISRKIGRFELANGGTIFLDEIGDIPPELQPKLLRVLQEQEFERLGSIQTLRVNVRVVAATSRDLPQMVQDRKFRGDLYYRLNVFPLRLPMLRERPEDIALLVRHFVDLFAARMHKKIENIPTETIDVLLGYPWPGNVRELQNFVERSVILSPGNTLRAPLAELNPSAETAVACQSTVPRTRTLMEAEREHILKALVETNWVVGGPKGAAARIGLQRTTLVSKMQRLGITRAQA
jgi:formate hydrogenlyase transcriptional activator